ncbi:hypothetical protein C2145_18870 [Bacillus velezensis]|nr:hypothetical protein DDT09_01610 [Bacillus amyloliquefaciens]POI18040.1 hypothetical protein C2145_18870 [Bacillus velezensis]
MYAHPPVFRGVCFYLVKYFTFILCNTSQTFAREKFDFWTKNTGDGFQIVDNILKRNRFRMLSSFQRD